MSPKQLYKHSIGKLMSASSGPFCHPDPYGLTDRVPYGKAPHAEVLGYVTLFNPFIVPLELALSFPLL